MNIIHFVITMKSFIEKHINGFALIFAIISIIAYILIIIFTKTTFMSTLGYYSIINMAFVLCLCMNMETNKSNETNKTYDVTTKDISTLPSILRTGRDILLSER